MRLTTNSLRIGFRTDKSVIVLTGKTLDYLFGSYFQLKNEVFKIGVKERLCGYDVQMLETFLKEVFGEDIRMMELRPPNSSETRPRVMVTSAAVDVKPHQLCLFRNYIGPYPNEHNEHAVTRYFPDFDQPGECKLLKWTSIAHEIHKTAALRWIF